MRLVDAEFEEKHYLSMVDNPTPDVSESDKRTALAISRAFQMARTVEPERKTGKWIDISLDYGDYDYKCSRCDSVQWYDSNFCPDCGADMRGEKNGKID